MGGVPDEGALEAGRGGVLYVYKGRAWIYLGRDLGILLVSGQCNASGGSGRKAHRYASYTGRGVHLVCQWEELRNLSGRLGE